MSPSIAAFIVSPNHHVIKTLSNSCLEVLGQPFSELCTDESKADALWLLKNLEDSNREINLSLQIKWLGGSKAVEVLGCQTPDKNFLIMFQTDVDDKQDSSVDLMAIIQQQATQIRQLEKDRVQLDKINQQGLGEMTSLNNSLATQHRQLQKQKIALDRAHKQLNDILGMTAHDIRNALLRIQGFSNLLLDVSDSMPSFEQHGVIQNIADSSEEALHILNDILDISKIQSGHLELKCTIFSVGLLLSKCLAQNKVLAEKKHQKIICEPIDKNCVVWGDQHRLIQVLNNLLSNAIKFSHPNTTIELGVNLGDTNLSIWVQDHGMGMDSNEIEALKTGQKISGRQGTQGEKSNGLGLAICKKVLEAHGGTLNIESQQGVGSRISLVLPVKNYPQQVDLKQEEAHELQQPPANNLEHVLSFCQNLKVLIVDDQPLNLRLLEMTLKKMVARVDSYTNPLEVLKINISHDLVISDQEMPEMNGIAFIKKLRENGYRGRAALLTAHELTHEQIKIVLSEGVDFVLRKPFRREDLLNILKD